MTFEELSQEKRLRYEQLWTAQRDQWVLVEPGPGDDYWRIFDPKNQVVLIIEDDEEAIAVRRKLVEVGLRRIPAAAFLEQIRNNTRFPTERDLSS